MPRPTAICVFLALWAGAADAENRALIVANESYDLAAAIRGAGDALDAKAALEAAGFVTVTASDLGAGDQRAALSDLLAAVAPGDRVVILLSGHFVRSSGDGWFLGTDTNVPDLATVSAEGLPLSVVLDVAARAPGGAVVLLGTESRRINIGEGLTAGIGLPDIPQGVTVISGDAAAVAEFAGGGLLRPGVTIAAMAETEPNLLVEGYIGATVPFLDEAAPTSPPSDDGTAAERAFWDATRAIGSAEGYEQYLQRYPRGRFAAEARAEIARIRAEPGLQARLAEDALSLTRGQRQEIQRHLALLGFDPKGIDGLFGPGTRAAIARWQTRTGFEANTYLTRDQLTRLSADADRRAAELEAEAAARQAEQERLDRLYWDQTGARGDEPGLRAYVKRYPDGLFAELAAERLAVFDDARRAEAAAADRAAWDRAVAADDIAAYRNYLAGYPDGAFAEDAQNRIIELDSESRGEADRAAAEAQEQALNLPPVARKLVEDRLRELGLKPGRADGNFDDDTRRAIRRYQQGRNLPVTGYLTQNTVAQLLTGGLIKFGD